MQEINDTRNPILERLDDQISWYSQKAKLNKQWFKSLQITQIFAAALIPYISNIRGVAYVAGGLGVLIVILQSLQSQGQYEHTWISYRTTEEQLQREKYLWIAGAGPYKSAQDRDILLAERIQDCLTTENTSWKTERQPNNPAKGQTTPC